MGFAPPHTVESCARDLLALVEELEVEVGAVLGHSFGGKVALAFSELAAGAAAGPFVEAVWVVDSTPGSGPAEGSVWRMLEVLRERPGPFSTRAEGVSAVEEMGFSTPVARWMSTNLVPWARLGAPARKRWLRARAADADDVEGRPEAAREPPGRALVWRLDADEMEALLGSFFDTPLWSAVEHPPPGTRVHVVKAEDSHILDAQACARIEAAALAHEGTRLHRVPGGHWVNADAPDQLHELLVAEMP
jgi:pimeloyl-ACP methyl ester carboxylesterase